MEKEDKNEQRDRELEGRSMTEALVRALVDRIAKRKECAPDKAGRNEGESAMAGNKKSSGKKYRQEIGDCLIEKGDQRIQKWGPK